jgi:hypothetical protein
MHMVSKHIFCSLALAGIAFAIPEARAERISFATRSTWQEWLVPTGAIEISPLGNISPIKMRKNINAVVDASDFGGGIRAVGSGARTAAQIMDGDLSTGWQPDASDPDDTWWIEVDLGRMVTAEKIRIRFAEDAPAMEFFTVQLSSGEQFFTNALVPIPGTLVYGIGQTFGFNKEYIVELDQSHVPVNVIRIEVSQITPDARLAEIEIESIGDNISLGIIERGGSIDLITDLQSVLEGGQNMADGKIVTNWSLNTLHQTVTGKDIFNRIIFDLGAHYWIDQLRIIGEPIGAPPSRRTQNGNFFWYQILGSDGSLAPDGSLRWEEVAFLSSSPDNPLRKRNFDHSFPLRKIRYLQHFYPSTEGGTIDREGTHSNYATFGFVSEYQMYGEGFPAEVGITSPIVDLSVVKGLTSLDWDADVPADTRIEIRTRTGNGVNQAYTFYDKNGKTVTESRYKKLIPSFRGAIDTSIAVSDDWSIWSEPYVSSGELFKSPSPRRYAQVEIRLLSDNPDVAPSLSALHLNVENPLALATRGEVFPIQVQPGNEEEFSYFIRPTFGGQSQGFNRLSLNASVPVHFSNLEIEGTPIDAQVVSTQEGFALELPNLVNSEVLVKLVFRSTVYQNRTRFDAFLGNSNLGEKVRQFIDAGDANDLINSESISVQLPINDELLANLHLSASVLTPNGDGIGDELQIEFDALKLVVPRPITVHIYDLAGRRVRELSSADGLAQRYSFTWDGRDQAAQMVPPGTYLVRVEIEGDSQSETVQRLLPVAY